MMERTITIKQSLEGQDQIILDPHRDPVLQVHLLLHQQHDTQDVFFILDSFC